MSNKSNTYYYEVHVKVPEWKFYKFQFWSTKRLGSRDIIIEEVVKRNLLNRQWHLPYITETKQIPVGEFVPDDKLYYQTTMSETEYTDKFITHPEIGLGLVSIRQSFKIKSTYAKKDDYY